MMTKRDQAGREELSGLLLHVILRSCRSGDLVRQAADWQKMIECMDSMLFWCGGRVFACRCEAGRVEFALEVACVPVARMLRYVSVPYSLYLNRADGRRGRVFKPARVYRVRWAFLSELVFWLHRALPGSGWTADAAYTSPGRSSCIDSQPVLSELGSGRNALREYRRLRARGVDEELAQGFASGGRGTPQIHERFGPAEELDRHKQQAILRAVVALVASRESVDLPQMQGRSRARPVCQARAMLTLACVRFGVSLPLIAELLNRHESTLQESVVRLRARDPEGLLSAADAIGAAVRGGSVNPPYASDETQEEQRAKATHPGAAVPNSGEQNR